MNITKPCGHVDPNDGGRTDWNDLNIPVWAMEEDGFLFVRTYMPRINMGATDIIEGGKREELCPNAIDVREFCEEID